MPFVRYSSYAGWTLAVMFGVRAIGDFNRVGFCKKIEGSLFATLDSTLYSPLCLVLSVGFAGLSWPMGAQ